MSLFDAELRSKEDTDVLLLELTSDTMNLILDYLYTGNVDINLKNVKELLSSAKYLILPELSVLCCDFLRSAMAPENCIGFLSWAKLYCCSTFEVEARNFVMRNFVEVSQKSDEYLGLLLEELQVLISSDELKETEEIVLDAILRWIDHDTEKRQCHIAELLKSVRLGLMDRSVFRRKVMVHRYMTANSESELFIKNVNRFLHDSKSISEKGVEVPTPDFFRPRYPHDILFAIGGWTGDIETYDIRADRWVKVGKVETDGPRSSYGTAVIGFNIYVIGGFNGREFLRSCRCFNAVEKTWSEVSPMNRPRCRLSVSVLDEVVYAIGGCIVFGHQGTAERYDYKRNQWSMIAPTIVHRSHASAATLNGKIYVVGGFSGQECMNSAEVYDPRANQWTLITAMNLRRKSLSCIAYHGHVYALGGVDGTTRLSSGEKYNPTTGTWTQIPYMHNPRSKFGIEVIDDKIFAIGGYNYATAQHEVEYYDEKSNKWIGASNMNACRGCLSACVITGLPNVCDYIFKDRDRLRVERQ
jgi:kelch-like protein 10